MVNRKQSNRADPSGLHPRNLHTERYDFDALSAKCPELVAYLHSNPTGDRTIDFADPDAVLCLNRALLAHHYDVAGWGIPSGYLCPPVPGRADYIHHLADILERDKAGALAGGELRGLDIGTGANIIYPILGQRSYGWRFVASDIDPAAVANAREILAQNPALDASIKVVQQEDPRSCFAGVIGEGDDFDFSICNPPFYRSADDARVANRRKLRNLGLGEGRNFGGRRSELWCPGGELKFISRMIKESVVFAAQVGWFTSLVSKGEHCDPLRKRLASAGAKRVEIVEMAQGQKRSRFLAWSFR